MFCGRITARRVGDGKGEQRVGLILDEEDRRVRGAATKALRFIQGDCGGSGRRREAARRAGGGWVTQRTHNPSRARGHRKARGSVRARLDLVEEAEVAVGSL